MEFVYISPKSDRQQSSALDCRIQLPVRVLSNTLRLETAIMRGISSLIDDDNENTIHSVEENVIFSKPTEVNQPKTKATGTNATVRRTAQSRTTSQKPKAKKDMGTRTTKKKSVTKRKAFEADVDTEEQPASKKALTGAAAQSEDELDSANIGPPQKKASSVTSRRRSKGGDFAEKRKDRSQSPGMIYTDPPNMEADNQKQPDEPPAKSTVLAERNANVTIGTAEDSPQRPSKKVFPRPRTQQDKAGKRAEYTSDVDKGSDANLRRKLGDMTRKFESADQKYRKLRDVGIGEANANIERMRKECEASTLASNELIVSLKEELKMHLPAAQEARQLQEDLKDLTTEIQNYKSTVVQLESSLAIAQNEVKSLSAKLAAARNSTNSNEPNTAKPPGSAIKNISQARTTTTGGVEPALPVQVAQLKEDLYSDLTGLIVRGVKRAEAGDVYDCIQTGRNGSE